jgi:hypothetical protein
MSSDFNEKMILLWIKGNPSALSSTKMFASDANAVQSKPGAHRFDILFANLKGPLAGEHVGAACDLGLKSPSAGAALYERPP